QSGSSGVPRMQLQGYSAESQDPHAHLTGSVRETEEFGGITSACETIQGSRSAGTAEVLLAHLGGCTWRTRRFREFTVVPLHVNHFAGELGSSRACDEGGCCNNEAPT